MLEILSYADAFELHTKDGACTLHCLTHMGRVIFGEEGVSAQPEPPDCVLDAIFPAARLLGLAYRRTSLNHFVLSALVPESEHDTVRQGTARTSHIMQHFSRATENKEECEPSSKTARAFQADDASRQLDAHDLHRKASRPLVSTLVGPEGHAIHVWRQWRRVHGADVLILREPSLDCLCAQLSHRMCTGEHAIEAALARLAHSLAVPPDTLRYRVLTITAHELELLYARAHLDPASDPLDALVVALLDARRTGRKLTPQRLDYDLAGTPASIKAQPFEFLKALQRLLPPERAPAVLAVPEVCAPHEVTANLDRWALFLARVAGQLPQLPLGIAVNETAYAAYCRDASESYHKAVLQESVIRLPMPDAHTVQRAIEMRLGTLPAELSSVAEKLVQCGVDEETVEAFARAAAATYPAPESEEAATAARSAAEAFLFDLLEHLPETAGRFELNLVESFHFGTRPAEIDLASRELRIAIEVDGHYHFTDASRYRRDRRKDFLLQQHGYLVLRFLAEDVVREMFHVRDVILEAVRLQLSSPESINGRKDA